MKRQKSDRLCKLEGDRHNHSLLRETPGTPAGKFLSWCQHPLAALGETSLRVGTGSLTPTGSPAGNQRPSHSYPPTFSNKAWTINVVNTQLSNLTTTRITHKKIKKKRHFLHIFRMLCFFTLTLRQIIKWYSLSKSDCYSGTPTNCLPFITLAN